MNVGLNIRRKTEEDWHNEKLFSRQNGGSGMNKEKINSSWCCDQIEELIKNYKISIQKTDNQDIKRQLEIVVNDLESILYG